MLMERGCPVLDTDHAGTNPINSMADIVDRLGKKIEIWNKQLEESEDSIEVDAEKLLLAQLKLTECLCKATSVYQAASCGLDVLLEHIEFDGGGIYLVTKDKLKLLVSVGLEDEFINVVDNLDKDSPQWKFIQTGPYFGPYPVDGFPESEIKKNSGLIGLCCIPLYFREKLIGCLNMATKQELIIDTKGRAAIITAASHIGEVMGRIALEQEQREQKIQFHALTEAADEAVAIFNEGSVVIANRAFGELVGIPTDSISGIHKSVFIHPEDLGVYFRLKGSLVPEDLSRPMNIRIKNVATGEYANSVVRFKNLKKLNGYEDCVVMLAHEWKPRE